MSFFRQEDKFGLASHWVKKSRHFHRETAPRAAAEVGLVEMNLAPNH
jgi:hypothetical protein